MIQRLFPVNRRNDWKHLTFTYGGGESKAELDEIIRLSLALWEKAG
jgi:hypothetical protein